MFVLLYNKIYRKEEILNIFFDRGSIYLIRRIFKNGKLGEIKEELKSNVSSEKIEQEIKNIFRQLNVSV